MRIEIVNAPQRSPEWFAVRAGRVTGSRAKDVIAAIKSGGEAAARRDYRMDLVVERLTKTSDDGDGYESKEMKRGTELEPQALAAYEAETGHVVRLTGFIKAIDIMVGCSLDGDVDNLTGLIEIKCPKRATHFGYMQSDKAPSSHMAQILHGLWVTGAQWCDFVSYDDRFPEGMQMAIRRVTRDEKAIAAYEQQVVAFLVEVDRDEQIARRMTNSRMVA